MTKEKLIEMIQRILIIETDDIDAEHVLEIAKLTVRKFFETKTA